MGAVSRLCVYSLQQPVRVSLGSTPLVSCTSTLADTQHCLVLLLLSTPVCDLPLLVLPLLHGVQAAPGEPPDVCQQLQQRLAQALPNSGRAVATQ